MAKKEANGLSHHEQLRYDYLLKNVHYLNEREQTEFKYLYQKLLRQQQSSKPVSQSYEPVSDDTDMTIYHEQPDDAAYQGDDLTDQGLPVFPADVPSQAPKRLARKATERRKPKTYRGSHPAAPKIKARKGFLKRFLIVFALVIVVLLAGVLVMFFKGVTGISNANKHYKPAIKEYFDGQETKEGTNILILGSDKRVTQGSADARTDTIMVVNIGNKQHDVKMVSFMRDTLVNIPGVSPTDYDRDQKLNTAFNIGEQNDNRGAELMRQTLKSNFDIDIKYYMMLDFESFAEAIDALFPDGVAINATFSTIDGEPVTSVEVPDDLRMDDKGNVPQQTITVGQQQMDGRTLLNYARFRKDDAGDFGRTKRQQQVMSEILKQVKNPTKLFTGSEALGKIYALTSTNVSYPYLLKTGIASLSDGDFAIEQTTIPAQGDWVDDYDVYGGQGLSIDFAKYKKELADLGFR